MTIKNLGEISFDDLMDCFLQAFENYYVKMPTDRDYYKRRWQAAKVDYERSYGMFDHNRLIGFVLHAVDIRNGSLTAFNTGTGVVPAYRGKRIVHSIYDYAIPALRQHKVEQCTLEVITTNEIAIRSYQSIGFEICKKYLCYSGAISLHEDNSLDLTELDFEEMDWDILPHQEFYSWDNQKESIGRGDYKFFQVINEGKPESFFIINPDTGYVAQCDLYDVNSNGWCRLFTGIQSVAQNIKIINIDERLEDKINYLNAIGLSHTVDQFGMHLDMQS